MKIILYLYGISLLIYLLLFIDAVIYNKKKSNGLPPKEDWCVYAIMLLTAPTVFLLLPYVLISEYNTKRKNKRWKEIDKQRKEMTGASGIVDADLFAEYSKHAETDLLFVPNKDIDRARTLYSVVSERNYSQIMSILDRLSLPLGCSLGVKEARQMGVGDHSRLVIRGIPNSFSLADTVMVDNCLSGVWQFFLLYNLWHVLPFFWHGQYSHRTYVLDMNDVETMMAKEGYHFRNQKQVDELDVMPSITQNGDRYFISCCYWNDWKGLVKVITFVRIENSRVMEIQTVEEKILYRYNCGIRY